MSKRFNHNNQHSGDRKKPRLNISLTNHDFPLSQKPGTSKEVDEWGDEAEDEILLLASQACENDISTLPDYSFCMNPGTTSTQLHDEPTTNNKFTFKQPNALPTGIITTNLKPSYNRISSPLPGISTNTFKNIKERVNLTDDLILNDKIFKSDDPEFVYRQLLQLQEENAKLKSENGKLLEKCVTKEGEASILRTQLKTCQVAVDNARMEKIKAQEKVQMDWTEKLTTANKQVQELRTQLDFKNLEIISTKEKCKMLESSKIKLTQVTLAQNDLNTSQRINNTQYKECFNSSRKVRQCSSAVQTDSKIHFYVLNRIKRTAKCKLKDILPHIINLNTDNQTSLIDNNEKLQKPADFTQNKCRIFSTFHRIPTTPAVIDKKVDLTVDKLYEDITFIVCEGYSESSQDRLNNILTSMHTCLRQVFVDLRNVHARMTAAFQRDMDDRYLEASGAFTDYCEQDLLNCRPLYRDEQAILPRRLTAVVAYLVKHSTNIDLKENIVNYCARGDASSHETLIDVVTSICEVLDNTSCAVLYSGLLQSITFLLQELLQYQPKSIPIDKTIKLIKQIITSRPIPAVICYILKLVNNLRICGDFKNALCYNSNMGNVKVDFDQGVLLFKKETCHLQILMKQIEYSLKCMLNERLVSATITTVGSLLELGSRVHVDISTSKSGCDCYLVLNQVLVYGLHCCAVMLDTSSDLCLEQKRDLQALCRAGTWHLYQRTTDVEFATRLSHNEGHYHVFVDICSEQKRDLQALCRAGIWHLYQRTTDVEFATRLSHNEGHYHVFVDVCDRYREDVVLDDVHGTMLSELVSTLQPSSEDLEMPATSNKHAWLDSFDKFSITD